MTLTKVEFFIFYCKMDFTQLRAAFDFSIVLGRELAGWCTQTGEIIGTCIMVGTEDTINITPSTMHKYSESINFHTHCTPRKYDANPPSGEDIMACVHNSLYYKQACTEFVITDEGIYIIECTAFNIEEEIFIQSLSDVMQWKNNLIKDINICIESNPKYFMQYVIMPQIAVTVQLREWM